MNYAFPALDTSTSGQVYDVPVPMSKYLEASFDEGVHYTVLNSLNRMSEMSLADTDDSPMIDAKTANEKWAVGNMKFEQPVRESVARIMNRRKREEMDRNFFLSNGSSKARFLPGMAAAMIGSVTNPLDLGLMFVPFVGEEAAVARATSSVGRVMARRLVTREVLKDAFPRAPILTESVINGMVGQTLFEVPAVFASAQDMSDYGPAQSLMNIAAGGTFAAGLHGLAKLVQRLGNGTKVEMARQALTQILQDEPVRVHELVRVDEHAIWEKLKFDADAARSAAYNSIDMDLLAKVVREQYGEKVESPAVRTSDGVIHTGPSHLDIEKKLQDTHIFVGPDGGEGQGFKTDKGRFISRDEAGKLVGLPDTGYNHLMHENDKLMSEAISTANPEQLGAAEYDRYQQLIEENPHLSKVDALKKIREERQGRRDRYLMQQPEIQARLEEYRKKEIDNYIAKERERFEQEKQGRFDKLKQQEIEAQIKAGKTLTPEEVQKAIPAAKFADMAEGDLDADIAALKKQQGIEEKPAEGKDGAKKEEEQGLFAGAIKGIDAAIKSLDHDPTKMSLPLADLLTLGIGRPVLKGLLMAVKEGLVLFNDLAKAIDHAMEWYGKQDKPTWKESVFHGTQENVNSFIDSGGNLRFKVMNPKPGKGELGSTFSDDIELSREYGSTIFEVDKSAIQGHAQILEQGGNEWNHKWDSGDLVIPAGKWKVTSDQIRAKLEQAVNEEAFSKESKIRVTAEMRKQNRMYHGTSMPYKGTKMRVPEKGKDYTLSAWGENNYQAISFSNDIKMAGDYAGRMAQSAWFQLEADVAELGKARGIEGEYGNIMGDEPIHDWVAKVTGELMTKGSSDPKKFAAFKKKWGIDPNDYQMRVYGADIPEKTKVVRLDEVAGGQEQYVPQMSKENELAKSEGYDAVEFIYPGETLREYNVFDPGKLEFTEYRQDEFGFEFKKITGDLSPEPFQPQLKAIQAAVDCILQKVI